MQVAPLGPGSQLALVQLPGRVRRSLEEFRKITGLTAVTSLATSLPEPRKPFALSPPVHPSCAKRLRSVGNPPCGEQWAIHVRSGRRSARLHRHICPIGMRCSCVPIHLGGQLVGVAKLVADPATSASVFSAAIAVLRLVVSATCQDSVVAVLSDEVRALRKRVADFQRILAPSEPSAGTDRAEGPKDALVDRVLAHLARHYQDPSLSLPAVAAFVDCNPRYLTTRFTKVVGEHMRTHLLTLRVACACRLLIGTDQLVKEIAFASGFSRTDRMERAFRRHVGVSPIEYRRIFAVP